MNKTYLALTAFMAFLLSSCLKDEGFEEGRYGTVNKNTEGQRFISIPLAANKTNPLGVESKAGFQPVSLFPASYDHKDAAPSDITVTLQLNNALVTAADPTITVLPASAVQVPKQTITIKAGERVSSERFAINMNTSALDPSKKYGIGFSISSVSDPGIQIPANLKNIVYVFTIKNKYDGVYKYLGTYSHPADRDPAWLRTQFTYPYDVELRTTGPNSVSFYNSAYGAGLLPLMVPGVSGFGATALDIVFDANDKVTSVNNPAPDSRNRQFTLTPGGDSRYDPATKTLYLKMSMSQNGFDPIPMDIKMEFIKARP
jgi:hypothetical protein